jgi:hypothetical protein
MAGVSPLLYSLQFRGFATPVAADVIEARATAPAGALVTTIGEDGLAGRFEAGEHDEAVLESRLVLADGGLDVSGRVEIGHGNVLRFRAVGRGRLTDSPDPHLRQGAVACEIVGGEGQFAGAAGRITSNLLLSDSGDLTDTHLGVVFLAAGAERAPAAPTRRGRA